MENLQKWLVIWSSATGRGNDFFTTPAGSRRHEVWKQWESAHPGCYVDELISRGETRDDET